MRKQMFWIPVSILAVALLAVSGVWTWRVGVANRDLAYSLEAERQRSFMEMVHHVEQIQALLGKGLVAGSTRQNMRFMGDVHYHAQSAVSNFTALPLPAETRAPMGKFLQQTGDFAASLLRGEAAGREMTAQSRAELSRLREESQRLNRQLQQMARDHLQSGFRWNPPLRFSWAALTGRMVGAPGKPATGPQSLASIVPGGWDEIGSAMGKLPVLLYDGPFSDHVAKRAPAMSGPLVTAADASQRALKYLPDSGRYAVTGQDETTGNLPAYSFRLAAGGGGPDYTVSVDVARRGGHLVQLLNGRMAGSPKLDLARAREIGQKYLVGVGYPGMVATYGQALDGFATVAYAYRENGMVIYPDQIKVKVALDTGEVVAVDARQYLMNHHVRTIAPAAISPQEAEEAVNPNLKVERVQLALIPNQAGTGEILTYEFLTRLDAETYLVYVNANTGMEEQILQQIDTDGGTFVL